MKRTALAQSSNQNTSFSIAPPPIADPTFEADKGNMRFSGQYLSVKMDLPAYASTVKLSGLGFNMVGRKATSDQLAFDFAFGMVVTSGKFDMNYTQAGTTIIGSASMVALTMPMSGNIEWQPYKGPVFNTILFGGLLLNLQSMTIDSTGTVSGPPTIYLSDTSTVTAVTTGGQFGAQMGWVLGDYHVDGFGMSVSQSGSASSSSSNGGSTSRDIPAYTSNSFGMDLKYVPWNLSLSSMIQNSKQADANFKIRMVTLSWSKPI